ncbi:MAG: clostripain-related cysteine peptidase [Candidatus Competibacteraceae bacterium]
MITKQLRIYLTTFSILLLSLLLAACGGGGGGNNDGGGNQENPAPSPAPTKASWTYMVYMAADNNLCDSALDDLNEMRKVGSNQDVNIVVQAEFSQNYCESNVPTNTLRGRITQGTDQASPYADLQDTGQNLDMTKKETLQDFIQWAKNNYLADHFALVLWDHGAGWKQSRSKSGSLRGALVDETSAGGSKLMTVQDIANAVNDAGSGIEVINFDACLMAMYEVAYPFGNLAQYLVGSEETEPGDGDPYDRILNRLKASPTMNATELSSVIVDEYYTSYQEGGREPVTKSALDLRQVATLNQQLQDLAGFLQANIATERPNVQTARDASVRYTYEFNKDLGDFLTRLKGLTGDATLKSKIDSIQTTLTGMVVDNKVFTPPGETAIAGSTGIAIFLPDRSQVDNADLDQYAQLAVNQAAREAATWSSLVNVLVTGDTGQSPLPTQEGNFAFRLTWDNRQVDVDLLVNEADGTWAAPYIGSTSSNAFLSDDSDNTGQTVEWYTARETVMQGRYDVFANYWDCYADDCTNVTTTVSLYKYDPRAGDTGFVLVEQRLLSKASPAPVDPSVDPTVDLSQFVTDILNGLYSDWWYFGGLQRAQTDGQKLPSPDFTSGPPDSVKLFKPIPVKHSKKKKF